MDRSNVTELIRQTELHKPVRPGVAASSLIELCGQSRGSFATTARFLTSASDLEAWLPVQIWFWSRGAGDQPRSASIRSMSSGGVPLWRPGLRSPGSPGSDVHSNRPLWAEPIGRDDRSDRLRRRRLG